MRLVLICIRLWSLIRKRTRSNISETLPDLPAFPGTVGFVPAAEHAHRGHHHHQAVVLTRSTGVQTDPDSAKVRTVTTHHHHHQFCRSSLSSSSPLSDRPADVGASIAHKAPSVVVGGLAGRSLGNAPSSALLCCSAPSNESRSIVYVCYTTCAQCSHQSDQLRRIVRCNTVAVHATRQVTSCTHAERARQ